MSAPFRHLLVPTDFSPCSDEAVRVGADLARRYGLPVTLLHVFEPPRHQVARGPREVNAMMGALEVRLGEVRHRVAAGGVTDVRTIVVQGAPLEQIVETARDGGFDLIVMGTHGAGGMRHLLLGSVAERVVHRAPCAVLVVRRDAALAQRAAS